jgi:hypothetical protein
MGTGLEEELFEAAVLALKDSIASSPKQSRRMLLRSLLTKFGFKTRTQERIHRLSNAMNEVGIHAAPPLAECPRDGWVALSLAIDPNPTGLPINPPDIWFEEIERKQFATEKEVEIRFIVPLLERLGYSEDDRADGFPIEIVVGSKRTVAEADFVLFDGRNRSMDNALLVIEAKRTGKRVKDFISQARSYAMFMGAPYYMVTNGDDILVLHYQSPIEADRVVFTGHRATLKENYNDLYRLIGKPNAVSKNAERRRKQV